MRAKQSMLQTGQVVCSSPMWLSYIFSLLNFFFLFNQPAKLLGIYIVRVNLDVLQ